MEAQKRETGGIESEGISGGSGGPELDPGILGFRVFTQIHVFSLSAKCHLFRVNYVEFMILDAHWILNVANSCF